MKMFLPFDTMTLHHDSGNRHDFPRLARESGFSFNLYRGRVDWCKIGNIDIDKIVRERDLETLQDLLSCVLSCSLSSEYDLKILDPNFLKIFQLAQLSTDFLLYCRNYLDHCVTVMQEQLRVALQEIEHLQQLKLRSTEELRCLEKKLKAQRTKVPNCSPVTVFKCSSCEKRFAGEQYLLAHQQRRHSELSAKEVASKTENDEVRDLKKQVQVLQDRLRVAEEALKEKQGFLTPHETTLQTALETQLQKTVTSSFNLNLSTPLSYDFTHKEPFPQLVSENATAADPLEPNAKIENQEEVSASGQSIEYFKQKYEATETAFLGQVEMLNCEIKTLREQLHEQHKAYEITIQRQLEELQCQHQADLNELRLSIKPKSRGSGDHIVAVSSVSSVNVIGGSSLPSLNQHTVQTWSDESSPSDTQIVKGSGETIIPSQLTKENTVSGPTRTDSIVLSSYETKFVPSQQEAGHHEEYVSPSDQESSESLSQSFHPSPLAPAHENSEERVGDVSGLKRRDCKDTPNHSKTMYGKSDSYSSSETGSSSYDSDSQSLSSEQQPCSSGLNVHHSRLQLTSQVFDGLKEDLLGLLNRRLRELGVDPEWNELPAASFHSNLATVKHHQNIAAKNHHSYFQIQEALIKAVDKRVAEHLKLQQPVSNSSRATKKKQSPGSFSLFARIKSHVKSRLSQSGHSSLASKHSLKSTPKTGDLVENVYSQEPSTSKSLHDYEILQEVPISVAKVPESLNSSSGKQKNSEGTPILNSVLSSSKPPSSHSTDMSYESISAKSKISVTNIKTYSRSMYANLNKSDIEVESKNLAADLAVKPPAQLQTSTPIKSQLSSSSTQGEQKPTFMSSDIESISEVETDANDGENSSRRSAVPQKPNSHTTMTTAELLANVAKFRQSKGQGTTSHSIVKSNLKSSLSTGNITKKKVVFRDEKDAFKSPTGFNTLELGPAHGSIESLTPQRSLSENSLSTHSIGPALTDRPVPQPRSSMPPTTPSPVSGATNVESDGDWDWDKDSSDNATLTSKETKTESYANPGFLSVRDTKSNWGLAIEKQSTMGTSDVIRVSHIVNDLERKLQANCEKPALGIKIAVPGPSAVPPTRSFTGISGRDVSGELGTSAFGSHISNKNDDNLSDLLMDDLSGSSD